MPPRNHASTQQRSPGRASQPGPPLRFVAAAHEHQEPIITQTVTPGVTTQNSVPANIPVPAYGFLRHIVLIVSWTGGVGGTLAADAPWNFFQSLWLQDVNGAYLCNPLDGFAALQANIYGGYAFRSDPRNSAIYSASATAGQFMLRIPVEVTRHNGYGALANQNAAASYMLGWTVNTSGNIWSVAPTTIPQFTIKAYVETWSQPNATDIKGRPQAQLPPLHGSSQQLSYNTKQIVAGSNTTQLTRVGNTIRYIMFIARNGTGARDDTVFPDPFQLNWDARVLTNEVQALRVAKQSEALQGASVRDTGVFVFFFNNSTTGGYGDESSDLWIPTVQSTRLELAGSSATAGNFQIITNDITQVEVDQASRYIMESQTGNLEHPDVTA